MTAFPARVRPFTETDAHGKDIVLGPGLTLPDIITRLYKPQFIKSVAERYGFLSRDNKEREYSPGLDDRYIFSSWKSVDKFRHDTLKLLDCLNESWVSLGLPLIKDEKRNILVPDKDYAWNALRRTDSTSRLVIQHYREVAFILSNVDIVLKNCIVRSVTWGWWVVSYTGRNSSDLNMFAGALNAFKRALPVLFNSKRFHSLSDALWQDAGDPLDTNPGYPYFRGDLDPNGIPITRIKMVEEAEGLLASARDRHKHDPSHSLWHHTLLEIDARFGKHGLPGAPLAVAPLRRQSPGYKWSHQFRMTSGGLISAEDEQGYNSQRVAWMVSYLYNLLVSGFHCRLKAVRMMLPGMYHDGPSRVRRLKELRDSTKAGRCFLAEADYSNYDRNIPVDIVRRITADFAEFMEDKDYLNEMAMYLHDDSTLIWPDYTPDGDSHGWVFKPGLLGLLSGVKVTSETGSFVNFVIHLQTLMNCEGWTEDQAVNYITMYKTEGVPIGSLPERVYIQSDDSLLIAPTISSLLKQGDEFNRLLKLAGLKGEVMIGDRFLMRHLYGGLDTPVPARVFQNTVSNETPPPSSLIFEVGLAARTDGLAASKSVDPFGTGVVYNITSAERSFTRMMLDMLISDISSANTPLPRAIKFLSVLRDSLNAKRSEQLNGYRREVVQELALIELVRAAKEGRAALQTYLYSLHKDKFKPGAAAITLEIENLAPELASVISQFALREHKFFVYATGKLGVKPVQMKI